PSGGAGTWYSPDPPRSSLMHCQVSPKFARPYSTQKPSWLSCGSQGSVSWLVSEPPKAAVGRSATPKSRAIALPPQPRALDKRFTVASSMPVSSRITVRRLHSRIRSGTTDARLDRPKWKRPKVSSNETEYIEVEVHQGWTSTSTDRE